MKVCLLKIKVKGEYLFKPLYNSDREFINKCKEDKPILVSHRRARNPKHHKLIFAIANCIKANLPEDHFFYYALPIDIIKAIMLDAGIVEYKHNLNGTVRAEPKSIAFENMSEDDFEPVSDIIFKTAARLLNVAENAFRANVGDYL